MSAAGAIWLGITPSLRKGLSDFHIHRDSGREIFHAALVEEINRNELVAAGFPVNTAAISYCSNARFCFREIFNFSACRAISFENLLSVENLAFIQGVG